MQASALVTFLRVFSHVVLALMLLAILYGGFMAVRYWNGIGV